MYEYICLENTWSYLFDYNNTEIILKNLNILKALFKLLFYLKFSRIINMEQLLPYIFHAYHSIHMKDKGDVYKNADRKKNKHFLAFLKSNSINFIFLKLILMSMHEFWLTDRCNLEEYFSFSLTFDIQIKLVALAIAFLIAADARVNSTSASRHAL